MFFKTNLNDCFLESHMKYKSFLIIKPKLFLYFSKKTDDNLTIKLKIF